MQPRVRTRALKIGFALTALFLAVAAHGGTFKPSEELLFTASRTAGTGDIREKLLKNPAVEGRWFFDVAMLMRGGYWSIAPGGYAIDPSMSSWEIAGIVTSEPKLKWTVIPEGFRKEQVADRLARDLGWTPEKRDAFLAVDLQTPYGLEDGFYFPDTYLIPTDEDVEAVTKRFINRFNDNFAPYVEKFREANIKYDTAIKLASLIQREAAGSHDMPLIAGILWKRLLIGMKLEVDATLQYMRGDEGKGYWAPIDIAVKKTDSPFNTYMYKGLPPQPISNPGMAAIDAVLNSEETECLFYLHAPDRSIHCSADYEGHLENIDEYLRNQD